MFVDASALVAMLTDEEEGDAIADTLARSETKLTSAVALWEAVAGLVKTYVMPIPEARAKVEELRRVAEIDVVPIGERELAFAVEAYAKFGKGRHPARLNMGDCFAFACAQANDVPLLFKGDDFSQTDIRDARAR